MPGIVRTRGDQVKHLQPVSSRSRGREIRNDPFRICQTEGRLASGPKEAVGEFAIGSGPGKLKRSEHHAEYGPGTFASSLLRKLRGQFALTAPANATMWIYDRLAGPDA